MGRPKSSKTLSNKEYCRKYREKNKEKLKQKDKERKKNAREYEKYVCPDKYMERLQKDRIRSRDYRAKKKAESEKNEELPSSSSSSPNFHQSSSSSVVPQGSAFSSKQSLVRSVTRAEKHLPNSPRKKTEIIGKLAKKYNLRIQFKDSRGRKAKILSDDQEQWIIDYLERPEVTYTNPGRKDNVYVGKVNGKKEYIQKRYLLWTLRDTVGILNNHEDGFQVSFEEDLSFGIFYRFIKSKKQFIYQRDIPDTSCLCEVCENSAMMAKAIKKWKKDHPTNAHDIIETYSCDSNDPKCMNNVCETCQPSKVYGSWHVESSSSNESETDDTPDSVSFTMWSREDKKIKKITKCLGQDEFDGEWERKVIELKEHIHRKRIQAAAYNQCKTGLEQGEAIFHVDYSESYKNKQQDEIQSAYFGQSSFSLFTACVYHLDGNDSLYKRPITVVSESSDHSRLAALTCSDFVMKEVEKHIFLKKIIIWSDGCASQFRSRYVF